MSVSLIFLLRVFCLHPLGKTRGLFYFGEKAAVKRIVLCGTSNDILYSFKFIRGDYL